MKLDFLEPVTTGRGPWASVYAATGPPDEAGLTRRELSWRELCRSLDEQGADPATVAAVREALEDAAPDAEPRALALFAAEGRVALECRLDEPPARSEATWSALPHVAPLVELSGREPPCLVARVDRAGADFELHGTGRAEAAGGVEGRDWPLHRASAGDWSVKHFQAAVENTWEENARLIADEITRMCETSGAELVVLAGGARECRAVRDHLPEALHGATSISEHGGRAAGTDDAPLMADVRAARMDHMARRTETVLDRFRAGRNASGRPEAAVEGVPAVTEAVQEHRVDTLLLTEAGSDLQREVWVGAEPGQVAARRSDAQALGAEPARPARADDALLIGTAAAGGEAVLVPGDGTADGGVPAGGVGALLRWPRGEEERAAQR
ncbi:Vms1/Ankzf1 family peptidyl-tRNA hydrolase [Streptomyces sp. CC208A]|uniref:baeRF2 domain-containing protein n=1 Tax=Streptomyces sp. CC208A TaxID=3044573 RepID=UPI0024A9C2F0|nr:Vms1/Ankzf1 family peptidyl-tRNA hydrolase [Streptomyces sp. CC208A]